MLLIRTNRPRVSFWRFTRQTSHPAPFRRVRLTRGTKRAEAPYWGPGPVLIRGVVELPPREGVAYAAQRPLVLAPLPVALLLGLLGLLLGLPGFGPLGGLLARLALPLLGSALGLQIKKLSTKTRRMASEPNSLEFGYSEARCTGKGRGS